MGHIVSSFCKNVLKIAASRPWFGMAI